MMIPMNKYLKGGTAFIYETQNQKMHNLPWAELATTNQNEADINVYGIPFDGAASIGKGTSEGPEKIRLLSKGLPPTTEEGVILENFLIYDAGDAPLDLNWERYYGDIAVSAEALIKDRFTLFLGGDHSVSIPLLKGFRNAYAGKKIGVIHFDCHADLMDEYEGHKWAHACPFRRFLELEGVETRDLAQVGMRSFEPEEVYFINESEIRFYHASKVDQLGVEEVVRQLAGAYGDYDAIYISIDIDVLDPAYAPGTGTPEGGGLTSRQMMYMTRELVKKLPVKAFDLVEISPPRDVNDITSWAGLKIIYELFAGLYENKNPECVKVRI